MRHIKAKKWEHQLKRVFDEIDTELEHAYGDRFPLHPARADRGETANPEMDGLFNVGASFSAGFGSPFGPGYVIEIRLATLQQIPTAFKEELREHTRLLLIEKLPLAFPEKRLFIDLEKNHLRIHGDLTLD